jgi:hypothetical protein
MQWTDGLNTVSKDTAAVHIRYLVQYPYDINNSVLCKNDKDSPRVVIESVVGAPSINTCMLYCPPTHMY